MSKYLIVYYSWSGRTEKLANAVAQALGADVERIREPKVRRGPWGALKAAFGGLVGKGAPIEPVKADFGQYDAVIFGCPVWVARIAGPLRTVLQQQGPKVGRFALLTTCGDGQTYPRIERELEKLTGTHPVAKINVMERDMDHGTFQESVDKFAADVRAAFGGA